MNYKKLSGESIQAKTGFKNEKMMLMYVSVIRNGDMDLMKKKQQCHQHLHGLKRSGVEVNVIGIRQQKKDLKDQTGRCCI